MSWPRRLYKCASSSSRALSMCHALRSRTSSVMAARVRLKMQCGTVISLFVVIVVLCGVDLVCGMFEHRHCNHQHPRPHEVSDRTKGTFSFSSLFFPFFHLCCLPFVWQTYAIQAARRLVITGTFFLSSINIQKITWSSYPDFVDQGIANFNKACVSRDTCSGCLSCIYTCILRASYFIFNQWTLLSFIKWTFKYSRIILLLIIFIIADAYGRYSS